MAKRTATEKRLLEKAARYLPGASLGNVFQKPEEAFFIARGKGSHVWDVSGNEYIDWLLGSGPALVGHAHPEVNKAVMEALQEGTTFFHTNERSALLAEEICKAVPCAEQVRFYSSGTEADFHAMRICRAYRKRDKVLKFEGGYHGTSDYGWVSITPTSPPPFPQPYAEAAGTPKAALDLVLVAPFNDLSTTSAIIEKHHDELACVIIEPLQRIIPPVPGFLKGLREVTAHYHIPLIFDEVVTGFRLAYGGAQEYYSVVPDLCTLAKAAGGGFPLAAVAGRTEIMKHYDPSAVEKSDYVYTVGTLSGNPIACAAGLATLKILRRKGTYERLHAVGSRLRAELARILTEAEIPNQVVGEDTCFDVYFQPEPVTTYRSTLKADRKMMAKYNDVMLKNGILKGGQKYYVSTVHTDEDVKRTIQAFKTAAEALQG